MKNNGYTGLVEEKRQLWYDHVERMDDDRLIKKARGNHPKGRRRIARPKIKWRDCIEW